MVDFGDRIEELNEAYGWTRYKLSQKAGISNSTLTNMLKRRAGISIYSLEKICRGYGIGIGEFLKENEVPEEENELLIRWRNLNDHQKHLIMDIIGEFRKRESK